MRIFLIVLDSFGIGEAPDAKAFGDAGAHTLRSLYNTGRLNIPNLISLGIANIEGTEYLGKCEKPLGAYGKFSEAGAGKDTTTGHWEIAGIKSTSPMPTYPGGFPDEVMDKFHRAIGIESLCNLPYSGTEVIKDFGIEHIKTRKPIVYTSQDSVFQIAAHEDIYSLDELYEMCRKAREILSAEHAVGRVIARPFITKDGEFKRSDSRRDFSIEPPESTLPDILKEAGVKVISVGKIFDIFAGRGLSEAHITHNNDEGMEKIEELMKSDFTGFCFANLVDFDSKYGHRQDAPGYTEAINRFDKYLGKYIGLLKEDDVLIITADHGCDPSDSSTDHTREYIPCLIYGDRISAGCEIGGECFADIGATVSDILLGENKLAFGKSFKDKILR